MDIALDSESKGRGFESHCDHLLLLMSVCLYLVNYLLGCFNVCVFGRFIYVGMYLYNSLFTTDCGPVESYLCC